MAIKIQTQKTEIPIELGDLKFAFDISDESIKRFRDNAVKIQKELESINVSDQDDKAMEQLKEILERGFTIMLGEGAFKKIYERSPSVMVVMNYFEQIANGIAAELNEMGYSETQAQKAKKYLANKKQPLSAPIMRSPLA